MGWPTKGSGRSYNSHVGFGQCVGGYTKKVVSSVILGRLCRYCDASPDSHKVKKHECVKNWTGSSKSMESAAILQMVMNSVLSGFIVKCIVSDDDSVMRAHLRHVKTPGDKKDKGKLPIWFHEPKFMADPTHRNKVVASHFYKLASKPVSQSRVSSVIARRMKRNWGYMLSQNRYCKNIDTFQEAAKGPLEHLFDNHQGCGQWCGAKKAEEVGKKYINPLGFLCKQKNALAYTQLKEITEKYGSPFFLEQSRHSFNTQTNEALNQSKEMLTPNNKVFHASKSFHYRHAIMVGTHNWGYKRYWQEVFDSIGVSYNVLLVNHLDRVVETKSRNKSRKQMQDVKRKRAFKQDAIEKRLLLEKRTQEYDSGIGLDIGFKNSNSTSNTVNKKACKCGSLTHKKIRSSECPLNRKHLKVKKLLRRQTTRV